MKSIGIIGCIALMVLLSTSAKIHARWSVDLETGAVFSGYNDVRIPGTSGTQISLSEELETDPTSFFRVRCSYSIRDRHRIAVLVAPLRLHAEGQVDRPVTFEDVEFPANVPLTSKYRFDSYRLTYRYEVYRAERFQAGLGLTAKIRDASISLEGDDQEAEKTNTGFVPLIHFSVQWTFAGPWSLLLEGDALAAPQGRAEDVLCALQYPLNENIALKAGYRILEGGADVDEVYSFTLVNYIILGAVIGF